MTVLRRVSAWLTEANELRLAGTSNSKRPVCDACILIYGAGRHLHRMQISADDTEVLQQALAHANQCMQHAWGHAVIELADAAAAEPLSPGEQDDVLWASTAVCDGEMPRHPSWAAGFEGLTDLRQQQILAYSRGRAAAPGNQTRCSDVTASGSATPDELVDHAIHACQTANQTIKVQLEAAPNGAAAIVSSAAVRAIAARLGVDISADPQPDTPRDSPIAA